MHRVPLLLLLLGLAGPLTGAPDVAGQVSLVRGEALLQGAGDPDTPQGPKEWTYLERNRTVVAGDLIWLAPNAVVELELPNGVTLRAGPDARFEIAALAPEPDIRIAAGPVFLCSRQGHRAPAAHAATPAVLVELPRRAAVRIDVAPLGTTRLTGKNGYVDYEAGGEPGFLSVDERIYVEPGLRASRSVFATDPDEFDGWTREACRGVEMEGLDQVGAGSLTEYGTWRTVGGLRVWSPHVDDGWQPYRAGFWQWLPDHGWIWVPEEPWGWTTHHYGSWSFAAGIGWVWLPGTAWHGGRVLWLRGTDGPAWVPLGPDGQPVLVHAGRSIWVTGRSVDPYTICRGRREREEDGVILPQRRDSLSTGRPPNAWSAVGAPEGASVRGGRTEDDDLGSARERARTIALRARDLRERPERGTGGWTIRLLPTDTEGLNRFGERPVSSRTTEGEPRDASGAAPPGGEVPGGGAGDAGSGWRPAPVVLPEARGLGREDPGIGTDPGLWRQKGRNSAAAGGVTSSEESGAATGSAPGLGEPSGETNKKAGDPTTKRPGFQQKGGVRPARKPTPKKEAEKGREEEAAAESSSNGKP